MPDMSELRASHESYVGEPSAPATPATASPSPSDSFERLFTEHANIAFGVALRLTRNRSDAEDLVQDAALLALRAYHSFEAGSNFKAWFLKILTNEYFNKYRRKRREPIAVDFDDTPDLFIYGHMAQAGLPTDGQDPASLLFDRLDTEEVVAAIDELPEEYRVVALLYFMQDLQYQDIAGVLACPVGTVRSRLHRGRRLLQKSLWRLAEERGIIADLTRDRMAE